MDFSYLPKTPKHINKLSNNCSLVAMCHLGLDPDTAMFCEKCGMFGRDLLRNIRKQAFTRKIPFHGRIEEFAKKHQQGSYLILAKNHACVVRDGYIGNCLKNRMIQSVYKITKKSS